MTWTSMKDQELKRRKSDRLVWMWTGIVMGTSMISVGLFADFPPSSFGIFDRVILYVVAATWLVCAFIHYRRKP